jgi:phosphohistidine phosphatase
MKELVLLRHAKSSWADEHVADFDRKLAPRGRKAAVAIGAWLAEHGFQPELILSSSARRTRDTVAGLGAIADAAEVVYEDALYLAEPEAILRRIAKLRPALTRVLVVGHNPGLERLALRLTPADSPEHARIASKFPTAALAWFTIDGDGWRSLAGRTQLKRFVVPAEVD